jgi:hypothetical protein
VIEQKLKSRLPPEYHSFNTEEILREAYSGQVEGEAIKALLASNTGCVVVLLSASTFTQCGSVKNSHWSIQENSVLDVQLKVSHSLFSVQQFTLQPGVQPSSYLSHTRRWPWT